MYGLLPKTGLGAMYYCDLALRPVLPVLVWTVALFLGLRVPLGCLGVCMCVLVLFSCENCLYRSLGT